MTIPNNIINCIEGFGDPSRRSKCTYELASYGKEALPAIRSILDGTLCNKFNIPYSKFGEYVRCAIISVRLMGRIANELEPLLIKFLYDDIIWIEIAQALYCCGVTLPETKTALLNVLEKGSGEASFECANTLVKLQLLDENEIKNLSKYRFRRNKNKN